MEKNLTLWAQLDKGKADSSSSMFEFQKCGLALFLNGF